MNPIRTLANICGSIAYAIGPERWIPRLTQRVLCSVRTKGKKVALTFDDGPNPEYTPLLLSKLAEYRVPVTFFLIGRNLKRHPDIGRRIVQEGHEVGNHTYNHRTLPFLSTANIRNELASTHQLILDLLNVQPVFLRPPNGLFTERALDTVEELGYRAHLVGDVYPVDVRLAALPEVTRGNIESAASGSSGLHHHSPRTVTWGSSTGTKSQTVRAALDGLIPRLCEQGFEFVTLSQLVSA